MKQLDSKRLMATDWVEQFTNAQVYELQKGLSQGVDILRYANPDYSSGQMAEIRRTMASGYDPEPLERVIDNRRFNSKQMEQLRITLQSGLDVRPLHNINYPSTAMKAIRDGLQYGYDVKPYLDDYSGKMLNEIVKWLKNGHDIDAYLNRGFRVKQLVELRVGLNAGLDVSPYADAELTVEEMSQKRQQLRNAHMTNRAQALKSQMEKAGLT